ncbi:ribosome silencing factor [Candidatus Neptunochlamydia vexilliferae]|nr:ribosome silencing factor [Candidatus Neptunochlamydia vexilliferae]
MTDYLKQIAQTIFDKKGSNIIAIDVKGISSITDYILIADGNVDRHVVSLAKEIQDVMREVGEKPAHVEGMEHGEWVVLDYFQVVIHLFLPEMRQKYQLERLWPDGKVIDLDFEVKK